MLRYARGEGISQIHRALGFTGVTIYKCIDKALAMGVKAGLKNRSHRPKEPVITEAAKAWVINMACTKPVDHGLVAELWTISARARYTRTHVREAGQGCLVRAGKATAWRVLKAHAIKPHKVRYYLERRDEHFEEKMKEVLLVYQEVAIHHTPSVNANGLG